MDYETFQKKKAYLEGTYSTESFLLQIVIDNLS